MFRQRNRDQDPATVALRTDEPVGSSYRGQRSVVERRRTPGGPSGGESAAIAAGMPPLGLGSDIAPAPSATTTLPPPEAER
ncbi:amidase family protein [Streptomyces sp. MK37H]|uniref:amidase family protein n=1 Tax=Streptomyces sp. MK37H TaxID=2699117 RepID=UPI0024929665|nr:amidase family protein [Streptomyces sp. MK37H]